MQCFVFVMLNEVKHPSDYACHHGFFVRLWRAQNDIWLRISDSSR
jgi:hypothetical protein